MNTKSDSPAVIAQLKRRIDAIAASAGTDAGGGGGGVFALGEAELDERLSGGLALGALHEVLMGDAAAAAGFALMLGQRSAPDARPILWVRTDGQARDTGGIYGPGLVELGIDPNRIVMVHAPDELAALQVGADIIGCAGIGATILDLGRARRLDLTASRRLALAARHAGTTAILLRTSESNFASAAVTRWQVSAAPSVMLVAEAPGRPMLRLELLRHRGGVAPFETLMEWDRDQRAFRAPLSRAVPAFPSRRTLEDGERAAA